MICPHCNIGILPEYCESFEISDKTYYYLYKCPGCGNGIMTKEYDDKILEIYPYSGYENFPENINKISTDFIEIYRQSLIAHNAGLTSISGIGFRKAFEFLIKDYAIYLYPDHKQDITTKNLSSVIKSYFEDNFLNSVFKKISWLGNDHAHYYNKHSDYDCDDLMRYIKACVSIIDSHLQLKELDSIPSI